MVTKIAGRIAIKVVRQPFFYVPFFELYILNIKAMTLILRFKCLILRFKLFNASRRRRKFLLENRDLLLRKRHALSTHAGKRDFFSNISEKG